ncbi:hypothetical protein [Streptomyces atratus]|uniref:hypothetical protein n=1 Tax=Streptomyces atratus TaxID=1893 RepID=UPI003405D756
MAWNPFPGDERTGRVRTLCPTWAAANMTVLPLTRCLPRTTSGRSVVGATVGGACSSFCRWWQWVR